MIPIYSADLDEELLYVVYYYPIMDWDKDSWEKRYSVNVYDSRTITHFTADGSLSSITPTGDVEEHYFSGVPWAVFYLTEDGESIFKCVIGLQDAYNKLLSDSVNDWEAFVDAYLVLTNISADAEDIAKMKTNRVLILDDDATASYLTKNSSDTPVQNLMDNINVAIHTIANSPDFSSEEFGSGVSSGIALQFKLVGFNNISSNIETNFRKAIMDRIGLLNNVFSLLDMDFYDISISFTHNLPTDLANVADNVNKLRGLVSDRTLLEQIPFIDDVDQEIERIERQGDADPYDLGSFTTSLGEVGDPNVTDAQVH